MLFKIGMFVPVDFVFRGDRIKVQWKLFFIYRAVSKLDFSILNTLSIGQ